MTKKFEELRAKMEPNRRLQNSAVTAANLQNFAPGEIDDRLDGEAPPAQLLNDDADEFAANRESIDDINRHELA